MRFCVFITVLTSLSLPTASAFAALKLCPLFADHMVVQRGAPIRIWGETLPRQSVAVELAGQSASAVAGEDGRFEVTLTAIDAGGPFELVIVADETRTVRDVMAGEVWLCSGQGNMSMPVSAARDAELELLDAELPHVRLISLHAAATGGGTHELRGRWSEATKKSVADFSAIGFFFGRRLHRSLNVPIGIIDNSLDGSVVESWIPLERLEEFPELRLLLDRRRLAVQQFQAAQKTQAEDGSVAKNDSDSDVSAMRRLIHPDVDPRRAGAAFQMAVSPIAGYGIRGVLWYQGEANVARAFQYRTLFPLMIRTWRQAWKRDELPFYWVQLPGFGSEVLEPADSPYAELRESQSLSLQSEPKTGQAVAIDLGEAARLFPMNKQDVASRLARLALARDYGFNIAHLSPTLVKKQSLGKQLALTFDNVGSGLTASGGKEPLGFQVAGRDNRFLWATARLYGKNQVIVWNDEILFPEHVRYAWADRPICNVATGEGLPLAPFRTDTLPGLTDEVR